MLTESQKACNYDTFRHIERVRNLLGDVVKELLDRAALHDQSKLESPEVEALTANTEKLAGLTYGSQEYAKQLQSSEEMKVYLAHHYANNPHHPQFHKDGVSDMTLIDILEMLVDWKAASERHNDGNILKSIEHNANRFNLSPQLVRILENTAKSLRYL